MKILALTRYGRLGASSRLRIYQYAPILHAQGIDLQVSPLLSNDYIKRLNNKQLSRMSNVISGYLKRIFVLLHSNKYDLLWIEKELFPDLPALFEQALNLFGIPYVVDIDDAVYHNYDHSPNLYKKLLADKISKVLRDSVLVLCGNDYLAEYARCAAAQRVEVIPTVIDIDRYTVANRGITDCIVVGWCGSPSTVKYLDIVAPALRELAKEFPLQLRVIGAYCAYPGIDVDCREWHEESEVREIQDVDIGIMPLADGPWERGKCGYKLIQYMACGKPVVASPVGVNNALVINGINGYTASTYDAWVDKLRTLMLDARIRSNAGALGRTLVEKCYCIQVTAPRVAMLLQECAGHK